MSVIDEAQMVHESLEFYAHGPATECPVTGVICHFKFLKVLLAHILGEVSVSTRACLPILVILVRT